MENEKDKYLRFLTTFASYKGNSTPGKECIKITVELPLSEVEEFKKLIAWQGKVLEALFRLDPGIPAEQNNQEMHKEEDLPY